MVAGRIPPPSPGHGRGASRSLVHRQELLTGALIGVTVADRYASFITVQGPSMHPQPLSPNQVTQPHNSSYGSKNRSYMYPGWTDSEQQCLLGHRTSVERLCLDRHGLSRGDVAIFRSPMDHRNFVVNRLIALPCDWIQVLEAVFWQIPKGHCWVEGDNVGISWDSRGYGPVRDTVAPMNFPLFRVILVDTTMTYC